MENGWRAPSLEITDTTNCSMLFQKLPLSLKHTNILSIMIKANARKGPGALLGLKWNGNRCV